MAKTNWQDPRTSEILSTHISGLQEAVGKLEESIGIDSVSETDIPLIEVFISNDDRCRIYQADEGKRNWLLSPAPIIKKNGVIITDDFEIDYGGGAVIFTTPILETDILTVDTTYTINQSSFNENIKIAKTPIGFPNRTDSIFSFDKFTRTFTIEPTDERYEVFFKGKKFIKNSPESITISNVTGLYYIYFDENGVLSTNQTFPGLQNMIYISYVYWNSDQTDPSLQFSPGDERHGTVMDKATHERLHAVDWTQWVRGLQLYGYTLNEDSNEAIKIALNNGVIADEDLFHNIVHSTNPTKLFEQNLSLLPVMYKEGANGAWKQDIATEYPIKNTTRVNFNNNDNGGWIQTEAPEGSFVAYYVAFTGDVEQPIKLIQGQRVDSNLADAQANNDDRDIQWGDSPFQEFKVLYRLVYQTSDSFNNDKKAMLVDVLDLRAAKRSPGGGGIVPSAHSNLTGLDYESSGHTGFASQVQVDDTDVRLVAIEDDYKQPEYIPNIEATAPLIPLSNEVVLGNASVEVYGNTIVNSIKGDLSDGLSPWTAISSTVSISNNIMSITGNGSGLYPSASRLSTIVATHGKRIFVRFRLKPNADQVRIDLMVNAGVTQSVSITDLDTTKFKDYYTIFTLANNQTEGNKVRVYAQATYHSATLAEGKVMEMLGGNDGVVVIDLDQHPQLQGLTAEEINARIPHYIDGMQSSGSLEIKSVGKNLFDKHKAKYGYHWSASNTLTARDNCWYSDEYISVNAGLTLVANNKVGSSVQIMTFNSSKSFIERVNLNPNNYYTIPESIYYIRISWYNYPSIETAQLEEGEISTPYEPYQESIVYVDEELRSLPNGVRDSVDGGTLFRNTKEYILQASDVFEMYTNHTNLDWARIKKPVDGIGYNNNNIKWTLLANYVEIFTATSASNLIENVGKYNTANNVVDIFIGFTKGTTLAAAQTALAGTKLIYQLATPEIKQLNIPMLTVFEKGTVYVTPKKRMVLDGSLNWSSHSGYTGYKRVQAIPIISPNSSILNTEVVLNQEGIVMENYSSNPTKANQVYLSRFNGNFYVSISNTDSDWAENYTPTPADIKAYFAKNPYTLTYEIDMAKTVLPTIKLTKIPSNKSAQIDSNTEAINKLAKVINNRVVNSRSDIADYINERITYHKLSMVTRDGQLDGIQKITGLAGKPKRIEIRGHRMTTHSFSIGCWEYGGQSALFQYAPNTINSNSTIVTIFNDSANGLHGRIQSVTDKDFEILWTKNGDGASGTISMYIICFY